MVDVFDRAVGGMTYLEYVLSLSPHAHWDLADTSGSVMDDKSANTHDGDYRDGVDAVPGDAAVSATALTTHLLTRDSSSSPVETKGIQSQAFDGTDHFGHFPDDGHFEGQTAFSFCAWVKMTDYTLAKYQAFVRKTESGTTCWGLTRVKPATDNVIRARLRAGGVTYEHTTLSGRDNNTNFWCATWDGANFALYLNGTQLATVAATGTMATNGAPVTIGRYDLATPEFFGGTISSVSCFPSGLTAPQVAELYRLGTAGGLAILGPTATIQKLTKRILA